MAIAAGSFALAATIWIRIGPLPAGLLDPDARPSLSIYDRHGERLFETRSATGTRGETIEADAIPPTLSAATMAAEDVRFRSHRGVDPVAIARAAWRDVRAGRILEGGSTITQQAAKLLLARQRSGTVARGWAAKLREAVVALRIEHRLTKDEILALYLNLAPYGNQIEGAARASEAYFGHGVAMLTPAEAAFLAALPRRPAGENPWHDPSAATTRARGVLATMAARGWIDGAAWAVARTERLNLQREPHGAIAPHFVAHVVAELGDARPRRVDTSLDASLERTISGIIAAHRAGLLAHHAENVAVAVLDNRTSEWIAWEGSGDYFDAAHGGTIDGVTSPRQPGSALKPFTYAAAFERGFDPATVLADVPSEFPTAESGILYSPRNYDGGFRGPLLARPALAGSENVPAVSVVSSIGVAAVARLLRRTGFTSLGENAAHYGLGLTLGDAEVRLDEMVAAYATFARGGEYVSPRDIDAVDGRPGATPAPERMVSAQTAFWITDILADNDARAYVFGRGGSLEFPFTVAAKTGTSTAYHDNWAIGYTRDVTVGVWVGNFDRSPLRDSSGVTGAGPIFHDVMLAAVERARGALPVGDASPIVPPPSSLARRPVCALSGLAPGDSCPTRAMEWLPATDERPMCTWHHASDEGVVTVWPDAYRAWARDANLLDDNPRRPSPASTIEPIAADGDHRARAAQPGTLAIQSPLSGATYLHDPTLRREYQALDLRAAGAAGIRLDWFVDGVLVGSSTGDTALRWPIERGTHTIEARDDAGRLASTRVIVR